MMTKQEFKELIDRQLNGQSSAEEDLHVDAFLQSYQEEHVDAQNQGEYLGEKILDQIRRGTYKKNKEKKRGNRQIYIWSRIAASVVIIACSYLLLQNVYNAEVTESIQVIELSKSTKRGEKLTVNLQDGSIIRLNSMSSITYSKPFTNFREVTLTGEAYFEVTKDTLRPFIVKSGELSTRVLGTSFNVSAYPDKNIAVTVSSGKVEVSAIDNLQSEPVQSVELAAGQQANYDLKSNSLESAKVDISKYSAWKDGIIVFEDASLAEVAMVLEAWYDVEIEFNNELLKNCAIHSRFENVSLENLLDQLVFTSNIEYTFQEGNRVIIKGHGCYN